MHDYFIIINLKFNMIKYFSSHTLKSIIKYLIDEILIFFISRLFLSTWVNSLV